MFAVSKKKAVVAASFAVGATLFAATAQAALTCDRKYARELFETTEYENICSCEYVTTRFIGSLQRHSDFQIALDTVSGSCPTHVGALTSTVTASIPAPAEVGQPDYDHYSGSPQDDGRVKGGREFDVARVEEEPEEPTVTTRGRGENAPPEEPPIDNGWPSDVPLPDLD